MPPSKLNKDPKEQKHDAKKRAEQKPPGSEWQTEKTAIKGDATEASKKVGTLFYKVYEGHFQAEDSKTRKNDRDLKNAKDRLNESTYGKH